MTKEDVEDASGEGEQECWFREEGCLELSEMECGSWRDCCQSRINTAIPVYRDKPRSKLDWLIDYCLPHEGPVIHNRAWLQIKYIILMNKIIH